MSNTNTPKFSRLKRVPLREYFPNEPKDFTPDLLEGFLTPIYHNWHQDSLFLCFLLPIDVRNPWDNIKITR